MILTQQYSGFPEGTELMFINDTETDDLIAKNKAVPKSFDKTMDRPPKDKMVKHSKRKVI